ncbi:MAG TPA: metalloregulator ArsR/SmtB family transcription factor [Polyangiaceae bacterium]
MADLDATLSALADPTRRGVVEVLKAGPQRASKLAELLEQTPPAMSRHLRVLRQAGLVYEESPPEDARIRLYRLNRAPFSELSEWVSEVEAFWGDQLDSFKRHVERRARRRR